MNRFSGSSPNPLQLGAAAPLSADDVDGGQQTIMFPFPSLLSPAEVWPAPSSGRSESRIEWWPSALSSSPSSPNSDLGRHSEPPPFTQSVAPPSPSLSSDRTAASSAIDSAFREVVKRKHRQVDRRRRQREAAWMDRLASLVSPPSSTVSSQPSKRRALDKIATLETVATTLETLLQRVAELEEQHASEDAQSGDARADASATCGKQQQQKPLLAWPVMLKPGAQTNSLGLNGTLVQGSIKALCVHAGTGRTVDCTSLAKLCMTGSSDCNLEMLTSPSWAACQRMLAPAAARGELSPFFYYSADESSPVDFIGTAQDPGLTRWLADLYHLLTRRKSVIEGTKRFKLSDGQWHNSTSRLWLLDRDSRKDKQQQQKAIEVDWDSIVVVLSLSPHRLEATSQQCEQSDSLEFDQAESEVARWRQWPAFSPS